MTTSRKITVTLPDEIFPKMDRWADHICATRSDVVRMALLNYLRQPER